MLNWSPGRRHWDGSVGWAGAVGGRWTWIRGIILSGRYVTASEIQRAGTTRIAGYPGRHGVSKQTVSQALADAAVNSAQAHRVVPPSEQRTAELIRELADEPADGKARLEALEDEIEQLVTAHPDGGLIRSLAGSGAGSPRATAAETQPSPRVGRPIFSRKRVGRNLCPMARKR
ncbi:hypothetical protein ACFRCI_19685 [Streptomyces sp. NPDC056638]|uniref:hypothetical protein n=1 Tax=Streptomyces sp. NPDC056638 TaxID=3345887 RepID=UPI00367A6FD9